MSAVTTQHNRPVVVGCNHRECAHPELERVASWPNAVTGIRTVASVLLSALGAAQQSLILLLAGLAVYWAGDVADGALARALRRETRIGAILDIACDRACAVVFYLGLLAIRPDVMAPVVVYLISFLIVDLILSLAFLRWPLSSPNYFYLADWPIWSWNWSKPAKAANSALFALALVWLQLPLLNLLVALALLVIKIGSLIRLTRLPPPPPADCAHQLKAISVTA
jgi:CDP-diacylglycerol---glycerol-3-phosphate 3-phosphatidyltransferase